MAGPKQGPHRSLLILVRPLHPMDKSDADMRFVIAVILWVHAVGHVLAAGTGIDVLLPVIWLLTLPFMIVGFTLGAVFKTHFSYLFPFRLMGMR